MWVWYVNCRFFPTAGLFSPADGVNGYARELRIEVVIVGSKSKSQIVWAGMISEIPNCFVISGAVVVGSL
ncbi:unnamed protein product [Linum trigynum]|uniref:Uncharacterized protein n=1 Tax=Linum trigynum TaxID=586398 RepID=A0AAV2G9W0_9ROSI